MASSRSMERDQLIVRPAAPQDAEIIWQWRNDLTTRSYSRNAGFIAWEDHLAWFATVVGNPDRVVSLVLAATSDPIAVVRFDRLSKTTADWLVNLNLRPESRGLGLGRHVLLAACRAFFDRQGQQRLRAEIHPRNIASRRVFCDLGFVLAIRPGDDFEIFERPAVAFPELNMSRSP